MSMKKALYLTIIFSLILTACKKELDHPPIQSLSDKNIVTLKTLINLYQGTPITITDTLSVYATVTMDELEGNIYKNIYVQDATGAINVRLESSSNFYVGDSVRINILGATLDNYNGVMQLDGIDPETNIVLQANDKPITPKTLTIDQIDTNLVNQLVHLKNVQFSAADLSTTYADGASQSSQNIMLEDCYGNAIILRTSGFANYANDSVAKGNGSIIAIVDRFNDDLQLKIRSVEEVKMNGERCVGTILNPGVELSKNFDDNSITSGGWSVIQVIGSDTWEISTAGGAPDPYLKISNYNGSNFPCENWFISPLLNFTEGSSPVLSFDNDVNYSGPALQLMISTEFDGTGDPNMVNWTNITGDVTWDPNTSSWGFANTGDIDLSAFSGQSIYIGFKYTGSDMDGSTWEIDEILITG